MTEQERWPRKQGVGVIEIKPEQINKVLDLVREIAPEVDDQLCVLSLALIVSCLSWGIKKDNALAALSFLYDIKDQEMKLSQTRN